MNKFVKNHVLGGHIGAASLWDKGGMILATEKSFAFYDQISQVVTHIINPEV